MTDKTATLLSAPYQDQTATWKAGATIGGVYHSVTLAKDHERLRIGAKVVVTQQADGHWRAKA